jgi:myo-inositol-1(or 4)-monophosphatase
MAYRSADINVMVRAAEKAGRALVRDFGEVEQLQVSRKGPADFVSTADIKAERIVRRELEKVRPDYGFLMEEGGVIKGADASSRWIVDPLDGTTNFLHGLPHFAVSIGLERNGEVVAGVIYDPIKDEIFWAEKGQGAYIGDRRMRVSGGGRLVDSLMATGIPFKGRDEGEGHERFLRQLAAMMSETSGVRRFGAAALDIAYVAAGRYDGFWETGISAWDVAAGVIMVREAGGYISQIDGRPHKLDSPTILASNDRLYTEIVKLLKSAG